MVDSDSEFLDLVSELGEIEARIVQAPVEPRVLDKWDVLGASLYKLGINDSDPISIEFIRYWPLHEPVPLFAGIVQQPSLDTRSDCHDCIVEDVTGTIRGFFDKSFKTLGPGSVVVGQNVSICRLGMFSYGLVFTCRNAQIISP